MDNSVLLSIRDLSISFPSGTHKNRVLHHVSFDIHTHKILGVVGESGSGKSVTSLAIMGLLPQKLACIDSGSIHYLNDSLLDLDQKKIYHS